MINIKDIKFALGVIEKCLKDRPMTASERESLESIVNSLKTFIANSEH